MADQRRVSDGFKSAVHKTSHSNRLSLSSPVTAKQDYVIRTSQWLESESFGSISPEYSKIKRCKPLRRSLVLFVATSITHAGPTTAGVVASGHDIVPFTTPDPIITSRNTGFFLRQLGIWQAFVGCNSRIWVYCGCTSLFPWPAEYPRGPAIGANLLILGEQRD